MKLICQKLFPERMMLKEENINIYWDIKTNSWKKYPDNHKKQEPWPVDYWENIDSSWYL